MGKKLMKTKKLTPRNVAPVQRENAATVARENGAICAIALSYARTAEEARESFGSPFAGDDAE